MPGIAALVNQSVANGKSIQLFYNTNTLNLGFELKAGDSSDDTNNNYVAQDKDRKGVVVNPSQVAGTTFYRGINIIVGFTYPVLKSGVTDYTLYDVSILSPVYRPLTTTAVSDTTITACSSSSQAFVYYLS
jgi:hypothetical protein